MQPEQKRKVLLWVVITLVVLVVAGAAGAGVRYYQTKHPAATAPKAKPLQPNVKKSQDFALQGNYDAAQKELDTALTNSNLSTDDKYTLLFQKGATYANQSKPKEALETYQMAAKVKETQSLYESMAHAAEQLDDKEQAIIYYKHAIQLILPSNVVGEGDKDSYEQAIRALGDQP